MYHDVSVFRASAYHLNRLLLRYADSGKTISMNMSTIICMSVKDFEDLGVHKTVQLILGGSCNGAEAMSIFRSVLIPMFDDDGSYAMRSLETSEMRLVRSCLIDQRDEDRMSYIQLCISLIL